LLHSFVKVQVAELRTALNNAQQLDFEPQLEHSEELIAALDRQLQEVAQQIRSGQTLSSPNISVEDAMRSLRQQCRLLNSAIAQMVSASHARERRQIGAAGLEMVQTLSDFTDTVEDVVASRQGKDSQAMERYINTKS
jgi:cell division protein FtsB